VERRPVVRSTGQLLFDLLHVVKIHVTSASA
jgi:hypothetical protein